MAKNLFLGTMKSNAVDNKKKSHHRTLARNEGWLPPLPAAYEEESSEDDDGWI